MKRKIIVCLLFVFGTLSFAQSGILAGEEDIKIVQTKWFDIIYPEKCKQTAKVLFENADSLYTKICTDYGVKPEIRMPVVITPAVESFNAYWTDYPYNHIVIYDTALIPDLAVFSQTILNIFKHELTHAVTYNLRSPFVKRLNRVFGDSISLQFWITSRGMGEGAAVTQESKEGEGRVNSEFLMHTLRQAKLENKIPGYLEAQPLSDAKPSGMCYYFNAAFVTWLQNTYGMEKYAKLWYQVLNMKSISLGGAYKKIYGKDHNALWEEFVAQIKVPDLIADPVKEEFTRNFFTGKETDNLNTSGRIFEELTFNGKGFAYIDSSCSSVFYIDYNPEKNDVKPRKLFEHKNIEKISFSSDGRYLLVNYLSLSNGNYKKQIKIFDTKTSSFYKMKDSGLTDGTIVEYEGSYYVVSQGFYSQNYSLKVYELSVNEKGKIKGEKIKWEKKFLWEQKASWFIPLENGQFAFVVKRGMENFIFISDVNEKTLVYAKCPKEMTAIRYLSYNRESKRISFSWTQKESFPRLGFFDIKSQKFLLEQKDISGGVYYPLLLNAEQNDGFSAVYVAKLSTEDKILLAEKKWKDFKHIRAEKEILPGENSNFFADELSPLGENTSQRNALFLEGSATFREEDASAFAPKPFSFVKAMTYYKKGLLLPFCGLESLDVTERTVYSIPLGITYTSSSPWDSDIIQVSMGYGIQTKSGAFGLGWSSEYNSFSYGAKGMLEVDGDGFKQTYGSAEGSYTYYFGTKSALTFQLSSFDYFGHSDFAGGTFKTNYFLNSQAAALTYSNIHKEGPGRYERAGFSVSSLIRYQYEENVNKDLSADFWDLGFTGKVYIPKLLPFESRTGFIYNLPAKIKINLYNSSSANEVSSFLGINFGSAELSNLFSYNAASFESEVILFGMDIHKAIPLIDFVYANNFMVSFVYGGGFNYDSDTRISSWHFLKTADYIEKIKNGEISYNDYFALNFSLAFSFIYGNSSTSLMSFKIIPDFQNKKVLWGLNFEANY